MPIHISSFQILVERSMREAGGAVESVAVAEATIDRNGLDKRATAAIAVSMDTPLGRVGLRVRPDGSLVFAIAISDGKVRALAIPPEQWRTWDGMRATWFEGKIGLRRMMSRGAI